MPSAMSSYTATFRTSYNAGSFFTDEKVGDVILCPSTSAQRILIGASNATSAMLHVESNQALVNGLLNSVTMNTNALTSAGIFLTLGDGATPSNVAAAPLLGALSGATMLDTSTSNTVTQPTGFNSTVTIYNTDSNATALAVQGNVTTTGDVQSTSDARYKTDVTPITGALAKVLALNGYTFRMLGAPEGAPRHMGLLAQEVQSVAPEAVAEDEQGRLTVAYGNLVGLLVSAIHELNAKLA